MKSIRKIEEIPDGLLVDRSWLRKHQIKDPLIDYYVKKGYLERLHYGVYRRPGPSLKWKNIVYSLQQLNCEVHIGGRSALELQGLAHYLQFNQEQNIKLYSAKKLPNWVNKIIDNVRFESHSLLLFEDKQQGLTTIPFGTWDWGLKISLPERAILEMLSDIPSNESFHMVNVFMQGLVNLRPDLTSELLSNCRSIKVKRLFLFLAERYHHQWFSRLDLQKVDLGKGKRLIYKKGKLDNKYLITIPREETNGEEQSIF